MAGSFGHLHLPTPSQTRSFAGSVALGGFALVVSLVVAVVVIGSMKMTLLGLSGIAGLILLLVMVPSPHLTPYIVFGAIPITGWLFKQSPGSGFNFLADALFLVSFLAVMLHPKVQRLPRSMAIPLYFLIALCFIQALNPNLSNTTMAVYGIRDSLLPMLLFFVGVNVFRARRQVERFLTFMMGIAAVNGAWATKQILVGLDAGEQAWAGEDVSPAFYVGTDLRAFATFDAPWGYAYYTDVALALGVGLLFATRSWRVRILTIVAIALNLSGMYESRVRTALAVGILGIVFMLLLQFRHRLRPIVVLSIVASALLVFTAMITVSLPSGLPNPDPVAEMLSSLNLFQDESMRDRLWNWSRVGIPTAIDNPFGKGIGTTGGVGSQFGAGSSITTDNTFLTFAIEFGWAGLILYVVLISAALIQGLRWHAAATERSTSWILASLVTVVVITIVSDMFNLYSTGANGAHFYFLIGMMASVALRAQPAPRPAWSARASPQPVPAQLHWGSHGHV